MSTMEEENVYNKSKIHLHFMTGLKLKKKKQFQMREGSMEDT